MLKKGKGAPRTVLSLLVTLLSVHQWGRAVACSCFFCMSAPGKRGKVAACTEEDGVLTSLCQSARWSPLGMSLGQNGAAILLKS